MNSNVRFKKYDGPSQVWVAEARGFKEGRDSTLAIFGGVHGSERTGVNVVKQLVDGRHPVNLDAGRIFVVQGNPKAVRMNERASIKGLNLNREFMYGGNPKHAHLDPKDRPYEAMRAQALIPILEQSDALLDLHDFTNPKNPRFLIADPNYAPGTDRSKDDGYRVARAITAHMPRTIISSGWTEADPGGSDGFMANLGKLGLCFELGDKTKPRQNLENAFGAVDRFIIAHAMFEGNLPEIFTEPAEPRFIWNEGAFVRQTDSEYELLLPEHLQPAFTPLPEGTPIVRMDGKIHTAPAGKLIIFPEENAPVGTEAYYLAHEFTLAA